MKDVNPVQAHDVRPHEELYDSITHLQESGLSNLIELRKEIVGEADANEVSEEATKGTPSLHAVLNSSSARIHSINTEIYEEVERIKQALFSRD